MITLTKEQVLMLHERLIETTGEARESGMKGCWILHCSTRFSPLEEKNCIRVFRQKRRSFAMA